MVVERLFYSLIPGFCGFFFVFKPKELNFPGTAMSERIQNTEKSCQPTR